MKPAFGNKATAEGLVTDPTPSAAEYLQYAQEQQQRLPARPDGDAQPFLALSDKMQRIRDLIDQIRDTTVPVLISGESGVGKEIIARAIHKNSQREKGAFVAVNCAALPSNLLETELFGHEKGAFTGAVQRHIGKFEQASNGTLLLDEVTEMDMSLQAKLLRALQEKEIERVGGSGPIPVKTRIIATTNRDIMTAVSMGEFRQDLFYRLHVIHIEVPPLRARAGEILPLAQAFLAQYCDHFGKSLMELSQCAKNKLSGHGWPGNVRELQNVIQRAVLLTAGTLVTSADLPIESDKAEQDVEWIQHLPIGRPLKDLETQFILETLKRHHGNRTHTARTLGISLRTLRNKINEFTADGISVTAPSSGRAN